MTTDLSLRASIDLGGELRPAPHLEALDELRRLTTAELRDRAAETLGDFAIDSLIVQTCLAGDRMDELELARRHRLACGGNPAIVPAGRYATAASRGEVDRGIDDPKSDAGGALAELEIGAELG